MKTDRQRTWVDSDIIFVNRRRLHWLLTFLISLSLLGLLLMSFEPSIFWNTIGSVDIKLLLLSALFFVSAQLLTVFRWQFLLKQLNRNKRFWSLTRHTLRGQLAAQLLLGRIGGEVVRVASVAYGENEKLVLIFSAIIDKIALLVAMISFALFGIFGSPAISRLLLVYWVALALLAVALLIMIALCRYKNHRFLHHAIELGNKLPFLGRHTPNLSEWVNLPRLSVDNILVILVLAFMLQLVYTVYSYLVARSMHIIISPIDWAAISALVAIGQLLPITIGGLGVREGLFAALLLLYDIPVEQSTAFSLVSFALLTLLLMISWLITELGFRRISLERFNGNGS